MNRILSVFLVSAILIFVLNEVNAWISTSQDKYLERINYLEKENAKLNEYLNNSMTEEDRVVSTIEKVSPSVVNIVASKDLVVYKQNPNMYIQNPFFNDPFFGDLFQFQWWWMQIMPRQQGQWQITQKKKVKVWGWSWFIYSNSWLILTNKHVVSDEDLDYVVVMNDWTEFKAKVLAKDPVNDIAVIKINPEEHANVIIKPISLWNSSNIKVWQKVLAIGNALWEFENTVTSGIISAKWRSIEASDIRWWWEEISNLLQTDAPINPWNSWWPLVNLRWEVIWMNTAIAQSAQWIGFAIPVNDLKFVAEKVLKEWALRVPFIWIRYALLDAKIAKTYNVKADYWALIVWNEQESWVVFNSPAQKAWLQDYDIIIEIDWEKIWKQYNDFRSLIIKHKVWDIVELKVIRDASEKVLKVELWEMK